MSALNRNLMDRIRDNDPLLFSLSRESEEDNDDEKEGESDEWVESLKILASLTDHDQEAKDTTKPKDSKTNQVPSTQRPEKHSVSTNDALACFRTLLAMLGEGAYLAQKTGQSIRQQTLHGQLSNNSNSTNQVQDWMESMVRPGALDRGFRDKKALNCRSTVAAMALKKIKKKRPSSRQMIKEPSQMDSIRRQRSSLIMNDPELKQLLEWTKNVDAVLADLTAPSNMSVILRLFDATTDGINEAMRFMLQTTIPEVLVLGTLEGAESTTAILAGFLRKRRSVMEIIPDSERVLDGEKSSTTRESKPNKKAASMKWILPFLGHVEKWLNRIANKIFRKKSSITLSLTTIHWTMSEFVILFLSSIAVWIIHYLGIIETPYGPVVKVLVVCFALALSIIQYMAQRRQSDKETPYFDEFPPLPDQCLPRQAWQNRIIDTVLNNHTSPVELDEVISTPSGQEPQHCLVQTNETILYGERGSGKTTLASLCCRKLISSSQHFPHGVVWLSLGGVTGSNFPYRMLLQLYGDLCRQLARSSQSLAVASAAANFDIELFTLYPFHEEDYDDYVSDTGIAHGKNGAIREQDEYQLMDDLRTELFRRLNLGVRRVLVVLDGVNDLSHTKWFQPPARSEKPANQDSCNQSEVVTTIDDPFQLLITTSEPLHKITNRQDKNSAFSDRLIQLGKLSLHEAISIFKQSEKVNSKLALSIATACDHIPLSLEHVRRMLAYGNTLDLFGTASKDQQIAMGEESWWKKFSGSPHSVDEEDRTTSMVGECVSQLFSTPTSIDMELCYILKVCFVAFVKVFDSHTTYEHSPMTTCVPSKIAFHLWDELLGSENVPADYVLKLEQILLRDKTNTATSRARFSFVGDCLVKLGFLREVYTDDPRGTLKGFVIANDAVHEVADRLVAELCDDSEEIVEDLFMHVLRGYQEYLSGIDKARLSPSHGKDERLFIISHMVHHMVLSGMVDKSLEMLQNNELIRIRLSEMGCLQGTQMHIDDAVSLLRLLDEKEEILSSSGKIVTLHLVQMAANIAFERVADQLLRIPAVSANDSFKVALSLYAMGLTLQDHGFHNEGFALFHESANISNVVLTADVQQPIVNRQMARMLRNISTIYLDKGNPMEAVSYLVESRSFAKSALFGAKKSNLEEIRALCLMGEALFESGKRAVALGIFREALVAVTSVFGKESFLYPAVMQKIGRVQCELGDFDNATTILSEALELQTALHGKPSIPVAETLQWLGRVQFDSRNLDDAIISFESAVSLWEKMPSLNEKTRLRYANTLEKLGMTHRQNGNLDDALRAYQKAMEVREDILGPDHEDMAQTFHNIGMVHCDMGNQEEAMNAYAQSLKLRQSNPPQNGSSIQGSRGGPSRDGLNSFADALMLRAVQMDPPTPDSIKQRSENLFRSGHGQSRCSLAIIFACVSILVDHMIKSEEPAKDHSSKDGGSSDAVRSKSTDAAKPGSLMGWARSIQPLLVSIVEAEMAFANESDDADAETSGPKTVSFCSFDFSSVRPPVDLTLGSNLHLETCISKLETVLRQVDSITSKKEDMEMRDASSGNSEIAKMLLVLHAMASSKEGGPLRDACARAMPQTSSKPWPTSRFALAAERLKTEFQSIVALDGLKKSDPISSVSAKSPMRERLSTLIGSAIRFHLRRLFDHVPLAYTITSARHPFQDMSACRARTHEIVAMCPAPMMNQEKKFTMKQNSSSSSSRPNIHLWDTPLSHVFILGLRQIHSYFSTLDAVRSSIEVSSDGASITLTLSQASKRYLDGRSKEKHIKEADVDAILNDITIAHTCLSAAQASKFILSLLEWPGVELAIENAGGWDTIESLSSLLTEFALDVEYEDEAHFSLLQNVSDLKHLLEINRVEMIAFANSSQKVLQDMWKRFKRGSSKRKRLANEEMIRQILLTDSITAAFPELTIPDSYEPYP